MSSNSEFHKLTTFTEYEFEKPRRNCISCGSSKLIYWDSVRGMSIVRCGECGVKFVNPFPTDKCIERLYESGMERWINIEEYERNRKPYFAFYLTHLKRLNPDGARLLDIGCGIGTFMKMAEEKGMSTLGLEISPADIAIARKRELNVCLLKKSESKLMSNFDFCTMLDFLEHVKNPVYFIEIARKVLDQDGILLIDTGDTGGMVGIVGKSRNPFIQNEGHLVFYDRKSIRVLLEFHGFKIVEVMSESCVRKISLIGKISRLLVSKPNMFVFAKK